MLTYT
jgi:hypothetical protein